ncbi:MAG: hypothetical protein MZV70_67135 [Desulfobacterales bacterium]|nr:hypothetical protein [Desulfobacterales bacterium]
MLQSAVNLLRTYVPRTTSTRPASPLLPRIPLRHGRNGSPGLVPRGTLPRPRSQQAACAVPPLCDGRRHAGAVTAWAEGHSMVLVEKAFDRILAGWDQLLRQEAAGRKSATLAASLLVDAFPYASSRISFRGFANRPVRSREAAQAFGSLESLRFLELVHPR